MSTVSYFFPPFNPIVLPHNPTIFLLASSAKRKRDAEDEDDGHHFPHNKGAASRHGSLNPFCDTATERSRLCQHDMTAADNCETVNSRTPTLVPNRGRVTPQSLHNSEIAKELAGLQPPIMNGFCHDSMIPSAGLSHKKGLRQQHLDALVAVMHRSTLDGDFQRAGRAWGMLLRAEVNGRSLDLRTGNRWGIGAEVHLQQGLQQSAMSSGRRSEYATMKNGTTLPETTFGSQGFAKAKVYYERLILQYPYRKALPHVIGPLHLHMAMFVCWIRSILGEHWLAEQELFDPPSSDGQKKGDATDENDEIGEERIRKDTLRRASGLADRLDSLLSSPPYSDKASFWNLRGMVALWIADLAFEGHPPPSDEVIQKNYYQLNIQDFHHLAETAKGFYSQSAGNHGTVERAKALLKAQDAFGRAELCSTPVE
ncbi:MAG: hypothetical protein Q9217_000557 [Psora testacea]